MSSSALAAGTRPAPAAARSSAARSSAAPFSPALAVLVFTALAAFSAVHWATLLADPPVGTALVLAAIAALAAAGLALATRAAPGGARRLGLAAAITLASAIAALLAAGLPLALLDPADWGTLRSNVDNGLAGIAGDVDFPYDGRNEWSRLAVMLGLALLLVLAAALAFWPHRGAPTGSRARLAALVLLVGVYSFAVIANVRDGELVRGIGLCALIAAWLWLPGLRRAGLPAAVAVVALAGGLALPAANRLDAAEPWFDYRDWSWATGGRTVAFDWDHEYGSIDWPRDGTTLFEVISEKPHYWRAAVLDRFDGVRWLRSERIFEPPLELPTEVEDPGGPSGTPQARALEERWIEQIGFRIHSLRSTLLVGAGRGREADGCDPAYSGPDGTVLVDDSPLVEGSAYAVQAYVPEPGERRLREAPATYAPALARYTEVEVPLPGRDPTGPYGTTEVDIPLRGERGEELRAAREALRRSRYGESYRLARQLTAPAPTALDAVRSVEIYLKRRYVYSEAVPEREFPLPAFLFEDRIGYCQQFSGAMALLLRMGGIPARVASGFSPGAPQRDDPNRYRVEDYDAHSWVEVWFNGIGWVAFDPTPAAAPANLQSTGPYRAGISGPLPRGGGIDRGRIRPLDLDRSRIEPASGPVDRGPDLSFVPPLLGLLGVCGLAGLGWRALRYRRLPPDAAAEAQVHELERALRRLGWEMPGGTTLRELRERFQLFGKSAASRYVSKLSASRYEPRDRGLPSLAERRALRRELARGGPRARLRALLALPPGGPAPRSRT